MSGTSAPMEGGAGAVSESCCANTVDDDVTAGNPDKMDITKTVPIASIFCCLFRYDINGMNVYVIYNKGGLPTPYCKYSVLYSTISLCHYNA